MVIKQEFYLDVLIVGVNCKSLCLKIHHVRTFSRDPALATSFEEKRLCHAVALAQLRDFK